MSQPRNGAYHFCATSIGKNSMTWQHPTIKKTWTYSLGVCLKDKGIGFGWHICFSIAPYTCKLKDIYDTFSPSLTPEELNFLIIRSEGQNLEDESDYKMLKIIDAARNFYFWLHNTLHFAMSYPWSILVSYKGNQQLRHMTGMSSGLSIRRKWAMLDSSCLVKSKRNLCLWYV